jgi:hypothetical protein
LRNTTAQRAINKMAENYQVLEELGSTSQCELHFELQLTMNQVEALEKCTKPLIGERGRLLP